MRDDPVFREALYCIKCGSCLNTCPVYQILGGDYGEVYLVRQEPYGHISQEMKKGCRSSVGMLWLWKVQS